MLVMRRKRRESIVVELTEREAAIFHSKELSPGMSFLRFEGMDEMEEGNALGLGREKFRRTKQRLAWFAKCVAESYEGYRPEWLSEWG